MMKRTGVRLGPDEPTPLTSQSPVNLQQPGVGTMHAISQSSQQQILAGATAMLSVGGVGGAFVRASRPQAPLLNYLKPPPQAVQYAPKPLQQQPPQQQQQQLQMQQRHKPMGSQSPGAAPQPPAQFQRLKVEDALSYLDQVKYKFNTQPQVYNDFLDIMKEFKSQTIDTPGVITRVSTLFKGHPELIVGFNTFLPPGYKIEVQSNGQVSVSMPSPSSLGAVGVGGSVMIPVHHAQPPLVHLLSVPQSVSSAIVHNLSVIPQTPPQQPPAPPPLPPPQPQPQQPPVQQQPPPQQPQNTLHHIQQAHQQIEAAAIQQQQQQHHGGPSPAPHAPAGQPVEFNHAIEYVNKIKSRFNRQPDKYKRFLEILHAYQRGHREQVKHSSKHQTEQEVYSQVAKLFENQEDLLVEFGQFLPDAKHHYPPPPSHSPHHQMESSPERYNMPSAPSPPQVIHTQQPVQVAIHQQVPVPKPPVVPQGPPLHHLKRSPSFSSAATQMGSIPPLKKPRVSPVCGVSVSSCPSAVPVSVSVARDVSYADAARLATLHEYNYFDRVRKALRNQEVYDNFLRCLLLYTNEIISGSELVCVTSPLLCRHPELQRWLQHFVTPHVDCDTGRAYENMDSSVNSTPTYERERLGSESKGLKYEPIGPLAAQLRFDRPQGDAAMDIDLSTCKRLGTSYCALPRTHDAARRCSGRTPLCREVLNDTWVSFPTWSEDSTFVTSRKTQYEEYIYRCEDERFELDVVIETNASTILVLEGVQKKLTRMSAEEAAKYRLDDCLGGHSPTIHQRALRRIYGDKAVDIIAGLKKNPVVAVPVVLRRLKAKEEEWREAQKGFNKQWREQNEKYYLKSLDHQGINFKQNDLKAMRSKSLFNEVESAYAARKPGPHVVLDFNCKSRQEAIRVVRDVSELLIHHARRQTTIQKAEKRRIKQLLRQFIPDLFNHPRIPLSDDEREEDDKDDAASPGSPAEENDDRQKNDMVKQEKEKQSSESDNSSDKSAKTNKNSKDKENTPKNINSTDSKESTVKESTAVSGATTNNVKRSNSNEDSVKSEVKPEPSENEDDFRDRPPHLGTFVCSMSWFLFLRLHGVVCARVCAARNAAHAAHSNNNNTSTNATRQSRHPAHIAFTTQPTNLPIEVSSPSEYYNALLELVKGVLDGNVEASTYEDAAREMLGIKAYPVYTLDKLVSYAVRQLQHCVSESWSSRCQELAARGTVSNAHYKRIATAALRPHAAFLYTVHSGDECRVTFELLESAGEGRTSPQLNNDNSRLSPTNQPRQPSNGETVSRVAAWSLYTERFVQPHLSTTTNNSNAAVFLRRNAGRRQECNVATTSCVRDEGGKDARARRKPLRLSDSEHATLRNRLRLVTARPLIVYRKGCLRSAQESHARLHNKRRERLRRWLRGQLKE